MKTKMLNSRRRKLAAAILSAFAILLLLAAIGILTEGYHSKRARNDTLKGVGSATENGDLSERVEEAPPASGEEALKGYMKTESVVGGSAARTPAGVKIAAKAIRTADITVEIKKGSFSREYARIVSIAEASGGYVSNSMAESTDSRISGGTLTLRVPADSYSKVMENLRNIGKVTSISERSEDVGEEYVDLESRINNLRAQISVYLSLLQKAKSIDEILSVQREISSVQEQIEQLTGRKNYLDNRIQFATINVTVIEEGAARPDGWGIKEAFADALRGVVDGFNAVVRFTGRAAVFAALIAVFLWSIYYFFVIRRRTKRGKGDFGER